MTARRAGRNGLRQSRSSPVLARDIAVYRTSDLDFIRPWTRLYWSDPAARLGLPLIASTYQVGFHEGCEWSGPDLDALEQEVAALESYWRQHVREGTLAHLLETADSLRRAIQIARDANGVVSIT